MYPEWVEKHRAKGTNISCIKGKYYLYEVTSVWNKEKQRAQKVTKKYLGRITEEGLIPPKEKGIKIEAPVSVKEYGACSVVNELGADIVSRLIEYFGDNGKMIFVLAVLKLLEHGSFNKMEQMYRHSYLSEMYKGLKLTGKDISLFMKSFGEKRDEIVRFMTSFIDGNEHILFDGTSIISQSDKMNINRLGYNAHRQYDPQINLLYAFACDSKMPVYYRIVAGNVRDVTAFKLSLEETKLYDMFVVADKGFGSKDNFKLLFDSGIKFIVPLRRNSTLFGEIGVETGNKANFDGYFIFNERPIWYRKLDAAVLYLDNDLKNLEEKDYINRIEKGIEGYTKDSFIERQYKFGTIILKSNLDDKTPEEIYCLYKERLDIEQSFDTLKNSLEQDKTYMQNEYSLETWAFINHISLMLNYKIYNLLRVNDLLSNYSVADFLLHLKYIFKIKINDDWFPTEISSKTSKLLKALNLHIT